MTATEVRRSQIRDKALQDLQRYEVLMLDGHFDYGNGYHGRVYLNPHRLFRYPSTIWRFAQDLIDVLPEDLVAASQVVAGPVTGGALLAHTIAGLLDSRRNLSDPPCLFAPFGVGSNGRHELRSFYRQLLAGKTVLVVDDVRNTGGTFAECAALVRDAGGTVVGTASIYDRQEARRQLDVPCFSLAEYRAPQNHPAGECPLCQACVPITRF
jgi:orotate phosphoribosyltransferase